MEAFEYLTNYYNNYDEGNRLSSRHGQVEFLTTLRYIEKYLKPGMKILEIGAGTGRYSHTLARRGYEVDAVELIQHNIELFSANTEPDEKITIARGNATELTGFKDDRYDLSLMLGPMYHLFTGTDKLSALSEALRVTKKGGVVFVAYCIADASVIGYGFKRGNIKELLHRGLLDIDTFRISSIPAEIFELHRKEDIDSLMSHFDTDRLHYVGTDMMTNHMRETVDAMDDDIFKLYLDYHFSVCERQDMVGITHHSLDIVRKK